MQHRRRYQPVVRQLAALVVLPLVMMGTVYALFSQQLSVVATGASVAYVASNGMFMTYTKTMTGTGPYTYTINPITLTNNNVNDTADWTVTFTVPSDVTTVSCVATAVTCTFNTTTKVLTVKSVLTKGWIVTGGNAAITATNMIQFTSTTPQYTLQNVTVTSTNYQTYASGLSTTITRTRSGSIHTLTIGITTAAGVTASGWQIRIPTTQACTLVTNLPANVTYVCTPTALYLNAPAYALSAGRTITVTPSPKVTYAINNWNVATATIKGKP